MTADGTCYPTKDEVDFALSIDFSLITKDGELIHPGKAT